MWKQIRIESEDHTMVGRVIRPEYLSPQFFMTAIVELKAVPHPYHYFKILCVGKTHLFVSMEGTGLNMHGFHNYYKEEILALNQNFYLEEPDVEANSN